MVIINNQSAISHGEFIAQCMKHESFYVKPINPIVGQEYYNKSVGSVLAWTGKNYIKIMDFKGKIL